MEHYLELQTAQGPLIALGVEHEKTRLVCWGYLTDAELPPGAVLEAGGDRYHADTPLAPGAHLYALEPSDEFTPLDRPVILRRHRA